ncbi:hypothetical protein [Nostoc sp. PA-18-2419]|uniref:hypothetical protein n=1 Tax=Nostoc sp. PA-18-2419 TaxID=2575443 RepID=UPI0011097B3C|nr:hypothetical protein [Nostoc sp. PA-18-2419]
MQVSKLQTIADLSLNDMLPALDIDGGVSGKPVLGKTSIQSIVDLFPNTPQGSSNSSGFSIPTTIKSVAASGDYFIGIDSNGELYKITKSDLLAGLSNNNTSGSNTSGSNTSLVDNLKAITTWNQLLISDTTGTSGNVTNWTDQSGNALDASNSSNYPTVLTNSTPSGKQAVNFDGSQYLTHTAISGTAKTIFIAAKHTNISLTDGYLLGNSSGNVKIFGYDDGANSPRLYSSNSDYFASSNYNNVSNQWKIFELTISNTKVCTLYINGTQDTKQITLNDDFESTRISGYSGGRNFVGQIAVIAQKNALLDASTRQSIRQKIADWVGITLP